MVQEFAAYVAERYQVEPAFNTMNLPAMAEFLLECGLQNPIICSSINAIGYLMSPSREDCEATIRTKPIRPIAMSVMASGAVRPRDAIRYVTGQDKIQAIVFGASSRTNILDSKRLIDEAWAGQSSA
jgi:hypothetical protein